MIVKIAIISIVSITFLVYCIALLNENKIAPKPRYYMCAISTSVFWLTIAVGAYFAYGVNVLSIFIWVLSPFVIFLELWGLWYKLKELKEQNCK